MDNNDTIKPEEVVVCNFIKILSRELRDPLNVAHGGLSLINDVCNESSSNGLILINHGITQMLDLLDILTDLTKLKQNGYNSLTEKIHVSTFIPKLDQRLTSMFEKEMLTQSHDIKVQYTKYQVSSLTIDVETVIKLITVICNNIIFVTANPVIDIEFKIINKKTYINISEINNGLSLKKIPYIYNPFRSLTTYSNNGSEVLVLNNIYINELLKLIHAKIEIKPSAEFGNYIQIQIPFNK